LRRTKQSPVKPERFSRLQRSKSVSPYSTATLLSAYLSQSPQDKSI
jgi:hypothetical protein